jgi:hypothetical protein
MKTAVMFPNRLDRETSRAGMYRETNRTGMYREISKKGTRGARPDR